jgi:hypothetical protein
MAKNQAGEAASVGREGVNKPQEEAGWDPLKEEKTEAAESTKDKPPIRLNLTRFLQEKPQSGGIRALLNAKYRTEVKTLAEWETALGDLLNKKTK